MESLPENRREGDNSQFILGSQCYHGDAPRQRQWKKYIDEGSATCLQKRGQRVKFSSFAAHRVSVATPHLYSCSAKTSDGDV